jgi:hypothetical protein
MRPTNPPIKRLAADLRRLLWQHDPVERSIDGAMRAWRLRALEETITDCATQAARALDVLHPDRPTQGRFDKAQLRGLADQPQQLLAVSGLPDDGEAGALEQASQPLTEEDVGGGENHPPPRP